MRVGIQLPEVEREVRWPEYLAMAKAAEEVGFESIWLGDHLLYDGAGAGAVGGVDADERARGGDRARCGSGRWWRAPGFHPPAVLAKMASTIDEISRGRFVLGLGSGWNRREFDAFGIPYDKRVSRFEEAFAIIRGLLAGERVTLDGTFHRADDVVLLPKPARQTPIMIGSNGRADARHRRSPTSRRGTRGGTTTATTPEGLGEADRGDRHPGHRLAQRVHARPARRAAGRAPAGRDGGGRAGRFAEHIRELGEAGADEVIVVASPITERSIRTLGELLPAR